MPTGEAARGGAGRAAAENAALHTEPTSHHQAVRILDDKRLKKPTKQSPAWRQPPAREALRESDEPSGAGRADNRPGGGRDKGTDSMAGRPTAVADCHAVSKRVFVGSARYLSSWHHFLSIKRKKKAFLHSRIFDSGNVCVLQSCMLLPS